MFYENGKYRACCGHKINTCHFDFVVFTESDSKKKERKFVESLSRLRRDWESPFVNFINILHTNFSNERHFGSFSLVTFWLWGEIRTKKIASKNLMKLTPFVNVTNIFTRRFCSYILSTKNDRAKL